MYSFPLLFPCPLSPPLPLLCYLLLQQCTVPNSCRRLFHPSASPGLIPLLPLLSLPSCPLPSAVDTPSASALFITPSLLLPLLCCPLFPPMYSAGHEAGGLRSLLASHLFFSLFCYFLFVSLVCCLSPAGYGSGGAEVLGWGHGGAGWGERPVCGATQAPHHCSGAGC